MLSRPYHRAVRRFGRILVLAAIAYAAPSASAVVTQFRTPSGNIGCVYASDFGHRPSLRCDIRSGLEPKPPGPKNCDLDWGDSYEMGVTGRVYVTCHGDTAIDPRSRVLRYGRTWRKPGFVCTSKPVGLRCRNRGRHGFFLSRQHSYRF
jgi:hypothetical protein